MDFKITNVIALAFISINLFIPFIPTRVFSQLSYSGLEGILLINKSHIFDYELSENALFSNEIFTPFLSKFLLSSIDFVDRRKDRFLFSHRLQLYLLRTQVGANRVRSSQEDAR